MKSAGRLARTHSNPRPLSFQEICQEAFGVIGLHPWEFWEYNIDEYLLRRKGFYDYQRVDLQNQLQHFRYMAYWCVFPHLKKTAQNKPWTEIIPDIYEKSTKPDDFNQWFEEQRKKAKQRNKKTIEKLKIGKRA